MIEEQSDNRVVVVGEVATTSESYRDDYTTIDGQTLEDILWPTGWVIDDYKVKSWSYGKLRITIERVAQEDKQNG